MGKAVVDQRIHVHPVVEKHIHEHPVKEEHIHTHPVLEEHIHKHPVAVKKLITLQWSKRRSSMRNPSKFAWRVNPPPSCLLPLITLTRSTIIIIIRNHLTKRKMPKLLSSFNFRKF